MSQKDIRVEVRVRNNLILSAMEKKGIASLKDLCRQIGLPNQYNLVMELVAMKKPALAKGGDWRPIVKELADFFDCMPEDLFSSAQQTGKLKKNRAHVELSHHELQDVMGVPRNAPTPELLFQAKELRAAVAKTLATLTPREERILRMRFGFSGTKEMTLEEVGAALNMSDVRVSQIEAKALRKLKHPGRKRILSSVASGDADDRVYPVFDTEVLESIR